MAESPAAIAQDPTAPAAERYDAQVEVTRQSITNHLLGGPDVVASIAEINDYLLEQDMAKAQRGSNIIHGPWSEQKKRAARGPESVFLDDRQVVIQSNGFWEKPGALSFTGMRSMVEQTPILNSIVLTRQRQLMRFCQPRMGDTGPGFVIKHVDPTKEVDDRDKAATELLQQFIMNCGWERDPRKRKALKRDTFPQFMAKHIRDSLVMDSAPIETEWKRDKGLGLDGFYAVDGATIRLCTEIGYEGDDAVFALQVIEGNVRTAYTYEDLIYEVRNPRTDVLACGYGYSETEMLIRIVTYLLNTMTYNAGFFDKNSIPRGILNLYGNYTPEDIAAFKRQWNAMVRGAQNNHNLPVMVSKDNESKADFVEVGGQLTEMAFGKWMSFLCAVACAIHGTAPEEVNLESFATTGKGLGGDDTEEKLVSGKDKGLRPLLSHVQGMTSDFIIQTFSPEYMLRFEGLDDEDQEKAFELRKLAITWNEGRKLIGMDAIPGKIGDAPLNPSLLPIWQAETGIGQPEEDFGDPDAENNGFGDDPTAGEAGQGAESDDNGDGQAAGAGEVADKDPPNGGFGELPEDAMSKALTAGDFGLAPLVLTIEV